VEAAGWLTDLDAYHLKRSAAYPVHYVYVFHSMVSSHMVFRPKAYDAYDTILCVGPHHTREIRTNEALQGLRPKRLIEHGYGRLDAIVEASRTRPAFRPSSGPAKSVLIAPSWGADSITATCADELITVLLSAGHGVTFRPHPMSVRQQKPVIDRIRSKFGSQPRFSLELDVRSSQSLHDADVMISDWSGAALSDLHLDLRPGNIVLADDGTLKFQVIDVRGRDIVCRIENDGILRSSKGLNVPYVKLNGPVLADRDRRMLEFAKAEGVDFVGVSFVESAEHVAQVRELLEGSPVGIVSKIENKFGLDRLREIIVASDAVMIDRGDLTAETEIESLAIMQKRILREAQRHAKPVIVATEMLHTMIRHPHPTKAEVTDISAAVLDGASAIMLSGETAIGDFPAQAIALVNRVASLVENAETLPDEAGSTLDDEAIPSAVGGAIHELCRKLPVTKVICLTASGFAPKMISKYRLKQPILAVTNSIEVGRKVSMSWGVQPLVLELKFSRRSSDHIIRTLRELYGREVISADDVIIVTAVKHPKTGNNMNTIEIYEVKDLIESQGWSRATCAEAASPSLSG